MGTGDWNPVRSGPCEAAVGGAKHPCAEQGLTLLGRSCALGGLPALESGGIPVGCGLELFFVNERGEGSDEEGAARGLDDTGIAIINGCVEDDLGLRPGAAIVAGADEFYAAKGTDVCFAAA